MSQITRRTAVSIIAAAPLALANAARAASHASAEVVIENFRFRPASLTVEAGQAVRFVNKDGARHTATSGNGAFDTGTLRRGDSIEIEIPAGEHAYFCKFHPNMKGMIVGS